MHKKVHPGGLHGKGTSLCSVSSHGQGTTFHTPHMCVCILHTDTTHSLQLAPCNNISHSAHTTPTPAKISSRPNQHHGSLFLIIKGCRLPTPTSPHTSLPHSPRPLVCATGTGSPLLSSCPARFLPLPQISFSLNNGSSRTRPLGRGPLAVGHPCPRRTTSVNCQQWPSCCRCPRSVLALDRKTGLRLPRHHPGRLHPTPVLLVSLNGSRPLVLPEKGSYACAQRLSASKTEILIDTMLTQPCLLGIESRISMHSRHCQQARLRLRRHQRSRVVSNLRNHTAASGVIRT